MAETGNVTDATSANLLDKYGKQKDKSKTQAQGTKLGYDQFLTLLCAEMQYQDPLEPTSNTEYVAQLATISQLEATLSMQSTQQNSMANDLVGKYVILKPTDEATGKTSYVDGVVDYVMYQNNEKIILNINNELYSIDDLDTVADEKYYEAVGMSKTFDSMLDQLPDLENINSSYSEAIKQIREMYDGLTSYGKQFISKDSLEKLERYEKRMKEITDAEKEKQTVADAEDTAKEASADTTGADV